MNRINFMQTGGWPLDTDVLDSMQKAYDIFNGLGFLAGDLSIINGCIVNGNSVSDGIVFINGEVLEFKGGVLGPSVIIVSQPQNAVFEDGVSKTIQNIRFATFGVATTSYPWASFKRAYPTKEIEGALAIKADMQAVNTALAQKASAIDVATALAQKEDKTVIQALLNRIDALEEKLSTVAVGAEVNVNADWNASIGDAKILNKPDISSPFLFKGNFQFGDTALTDSMLTVTFSELGTANYLVAGSLVSKGADFNNDNDVFWMIKNKTSTSFKLCLREIAGLTQNLEFNYVIIPF